MEYSSSQTLQSTSFLTSSRNLGLSGRKKYMKAPIRDGMAERNMKSLQLWKVKLPRGKLMLPLGMMAQAKAPQSRRPNIQNMDCTPKYGPRYLFLMNSDVYGNITGSDPPTLEDGDKNFFDDKGKMPLIRNAYPNPLKNLNRTNSQNQGEKAERIPNTALTVREATMVVLRPIMSAEPPQI